MAATPRDILSVCSGVAGLDVGIARAFRGARTKCYIEREAYPAVCLVAAMEDGALDPAPVWLGDLGAFPANGWAGLVDTVAASIPCQGNSVAGARGGIDDPRWLWPQTRRLLRLVRPRYFILENVPGLLNVSDGRALGGLLGDLDALGFDAEWGCLSAAAIGAPFGGDRLWLLAWRREMAAHQPGFTTPRRPHAHGCHPPLGAAGGRQLQRLGDAGVLAPAGGRPEGEAPERERGRHPAGDPGEGGHGQTLDAATSGWAALVQGRGSEQRAAPAGAGSRGCTTPLDAADEARSEGRRLSGEQCAGERVARTAGRPSNPIPDWPPLPDDTDGWRAVLDSRPELAPAQPAVRRVAAVREGDDRLDVRVSGACSCPRGRRIAAIGNAVCPDQCAWALRALWHRAFGEIL